MGDTMEYEDIVKVKGKGRKLVKAFKWEKDRWGDVTITEIKLQGENFWRKIDLQCSRSVFLLKDKGLVLKFEDGDWQTRTEEDNYKGFSKKHRKRVPKHFGCYDLTKKSGEFDIWVSVHQYIDIDRTKEMTEKQLDKLQVWCDDITEVGDVGPDTGVTAQQMMQLTRGLIRTVNGGCWTVGCSGIRLYVLTYQAVYEIIV